MVVLEVQLDESEFLRTLPSVDTYLLIFASRIYCVVIGKAAHYKKHSALRKPSSAVLRISFELPFTASLVQSSF